MKYNKCTIRKALLLSYFILHTSYFCIPVQSQLHPAGPGAGVAVDSLHLPEMSMDSLIKLDSIQRARMLEEERRFQRTKQLATQRELDLTNDGKPEVLRLSGYVAKKIDDTKLTFTIKSGKKTVFEDSWTAVGY